MHSKTNGSRFESGTVGRPTVIPTAQLIVEVFESASKDVKDRMLTQLVGQVYESAPPNDRFILVEHLMRHLPALSILALANGIFTNIRWRGGWQEIQIRLENAKYLRAGEVMALVEYVQKVSVEALESLAQVIASSPAMAGSVTAAILVALLMRDRESREGENHLVESADDCLAFTSRR